MKFWLRRGFLDDIPEQRQNLSPTVFSPFFTTVLTLLNKKSSSNGNGLSGVDRVRSSAVI